MINAPASTPEKTYPSNRPGPDPVGRLATRTSHPCPLCVDAGITAIGGTTPTLAALDDRTFCRTHGWTTVDETP